MSAKLCEKIDATSYSDPSTAEQFFSGEALKKVHAYISARECPDHTAFPTHCTIGLFFGFFFDGTNNNLKKDYRRWVSLRSTPSYDSFNLKIEA